MILGNENIMKTEEFHKAVSFVGRAVIEDNGARNHYFG